MARTVPSLHGRLLALLLPVAVLAMLVSVVAVVVIADDASEGLLDHGLTEAVALGVEELRAHPDGQFVELPARAQRVLLATAEDRVFFALRDGDGRLLAGDYLLGADLPWGTLKEPAFFDLNHGGYWLRGVSVVFDVAGAPRQLTVATTALTREGLMGEILLGMVAPQMILFLLAIVLVWAGVRHGLAPLAELREQIARRSEHDLQPLETHRTPQELHPMVAEINDLFSRLDGAIAAQRNFVADAAHQLRTPVAGLLAQIESEPAATSNPALLQTARRLARLVAQLLAMSRAEPGVAAGQTDFDLAVLIREAAADWLPQALRQGTEIGFELSPAVVCGSPHAWREMLANLVDNAIRYGRPGGQVTVRCGMANGEAVVQVADDGPGIPAEERDRVFERFYRPAGTSSDGCGLGLPIVRAFAEQQGVKVSLGATTPEGGLCVELRAASKAGRESSA